MEDLLRHVRRFAARYDLFPSHGVVVAGVSGGPDSLCLLHVLRRLAAEYGFSLQAAHLDHGLRGEDAAADARFVAETAAAWGVPCTLGRADVAALAQARGLSLEEAARQARYRFLVETAAAAAAAAGAATIAVGHNADDQAETVLMHFLRGSAAAGLRGMLPKTGVAGWVAQSPALQPLSLVRPLLTVPRSAIEAYCAAHDLHPRRDATNDDTSLRRNRVRHELLPLLEQYNPAIRETLGHTAAVMAGDDEVLEDAAAGAWARVTRAGRAIPGRAPGEAEACLDLREWRDLPLGLQRATLRRAISRVRGSLRDVAWEHVERAVWLAREGTTGQSATLAAGLALEIEYDTLRVGFEGHAEAQPSAAPSAASAASPWPQLPGPLALAVPGVTALPGGWRVTVKRIARDEGLSTDSLERIERIIGNARAPNPFNPFPESVDSPWSAWLDADAAGPELILRPRRPGDRFQPYGLGGHSVKLNEFMIDVKLPRAARAGWPLLAGAHGIAWVCGLRTADWAAVRPGTQSVYRIDIIRIET